MNSIMKKMSETIVFFGSGPVAAESLRLLAKQFAIEAVITKPKPEHHRGDFPVITTAESLNLPLHTVKNKAELSLLIKSAGLKSRLAVLIDFGIIVTQDVIDYFPLGIINSHFSLLPEWRGADPISFAILSGQDKTGVSLMLIDAGMDTGKILCQKSHPISAQATTPQLTEELIRLSNELLGEYLPRYTAGKVQPRAQSHPERATYSRKLRKEDGVINWHKPAVQIEREIRAFLEWPRSRTTLAGKEVIITKAHAVPSEPVEAKPGDVEYISDAKTIMISTASGSLCIDRLQPAGKKEIDAAAFINGYLK